MGNEMKDAGPSPEFLNWMQEREAGRRRPPGIDDWCQSLERQAVYVLGHLPCTHPNLLGADSDDDTHNGGYTYVLQATGGGLVKIGRARSPADRLRDIQAMSPVRLEIVAITDGQELERRWHVQFYKQRVHGEWFAPEVAEFFRAHGAPAACVRCAIHGDGRIKPPTRRQLAAMERAAAAQREAALAPKPTPKPANANAEPALKPGQFMWRGQLRG